LEILLVLLTRGNNTLPLSRKIRMIL